MVNTRDQDLYLLQNEHGLIKIGRSVDAAKRRTQLGRSEHCTIHSVVQFYRSGHAEEAAHIALSKHHLFGEWFSGSDEARTAIEEKLKIEGIKWPVSYNAASAERWVFHMLQVRNVRRLKKAILRECAILSSANEPHPVYDLSIFGLLQHPLINAAGDLEMHVVASKPTRCYRDRPSDELKTIPCYTSDVQSALRIWPDKGRPTEWRDSALKCCIAGLSALNASVCEVSRSK